MTSRAWDTATGKGPCRGQFRQVCTRSFPACAGVVFVLLVAGCDRDPDTTYGTVRGESLNGLSAFVQLLRDVGHRTATRRTLGERMVGRHDAAIVFADTFVAPEDDARELLGRFLAAAGAQTVVYVIRDSDAAIDYWRTIAASPGLTADQVRTARERLADAESGLRAARQKTFAAGEPDDEPVAFGLAAREQPLPGPIAVALSGADGGTVTADWPLGRRLEAAAAARPLWTHEGEPLLVESGSRDRTLILASAAPLLNGGLVDPGNRRLARDLIARLPADARVVVVGSTWMWTNDDDEEQPSMWRLLAVQPNPWIAAQALIGMILFCWWRAPIFGRPRREEGGRAQDFGHHVAALAALLRRSRDEDFARGRVDAWRRPGERNES